MAARLPAAPLRVPTGTGKAGPLQRSAYEASHDLLTGLADRHEFERQARALIDEARQQGVEHALLHLHVDGLQAVREAGGPQAADALQRELAVVLRARLGVADTLARMGEEEFGALLHGCFRGKARAVAESLADAARLYRFVREDRVFEVVLQVGMMAITGQTSDLGHVLQAAEVASGAARRRGNDIGLYQPGEVDALYRQGDEDWVERLQRAFAENRLRLYRQRIEPVQGDSPAKQYEVLLRLETPDGELIPPKTFLPSVERRNLMPLLDRWVVSDLLRRLAVEGIAGREYGINVSSASVADQRFLMFVLEALAGTGIPPPALCFEIPLSAALADVAAARHFTGALKSRGCKSCLERVDAGESSFGCLRALEVDYLKIDGSLVRGMLTDPADWAAVEAIVRVAKVMGIETIAEFVEGAGTREALVQIGVDRVQGFAVDRPEPIGGAS